MPVQFVERWPPVYDAEDLASTIRELVRSGRLLKQFFRRDSQFEGVCQGDIIEMDAEIPYIAEDGQPALLDQARFWMVIGNTCDISRSRSDIRWSQLVPIYDLGPEHELPAQDLVDYGGYRPSRVFYVPPWSSAVKERAFIADLLRPVTVDKIALCEVAKVQATLDFHAWVLLHSCLVRFLARDDGRFD